MDEQILSRGAGMVEMAGKPELPSGAAAPSGRPAVLYLGGFGRSGSTLLERMLGQVSGVTALGEVLHLVERGLLGNERCGCGRDFRMCPFWTEVGAAFGSWDRLDAGGLLASRRALSNRRVHRLVAGARGGTYQSFLDTVYRSARDVSGARLLVDSSKHPAYAFELRRHVLLRAVLVIRDSRGVAYSWSREDVARPEVAEDTAYMPTYAPLGSTFRWSTYSLLFDLLRATGTPLMTVRYEDLIRDPGVVLTRVLDFAGIASAPDTLVAVDQQSVVLGVDHTVAGNPMRFKQGRIALRLDEEWRRSMTARDRRLVGVASWPLRARYGYLDRRRD